MKPVKIAIGYGARLVPDQNSDTTEDKALAVFAINGEGGTGVAFNGHEFEICDISVTNTPHGWYYNIYHGSGYEGETRPREDVMIIHYPLDQRANKKDWNGATVRLM